ncbi:hypothetical protein B296_00027055 [Ensete ventricosum]|uniref:Uncharacterized protein n=1 Tax=Ensete ventricosum TaxID=4639 RepID=A0A426Z4I1_ENSVE|nr:hypothetical protein B296_00027055 [Ensete ventricosum]
MPKADNFSRDYGPHQCSIDQNVLYHIGARRSAMSRAPRLTSTPEPSTSDMSPEQNIGARRRALNRLAARVVELGSGGGTSGRVGRQLLKGGRCKSLYSGCCRSSVPGNLAALVAYHAIIYFHHARRPCELGDLNGVGADPTEHELGNLNGVGADLTEHELGNWNGARADPTEHELGNWNGARADSIEHELGNWNGVGADPTEHELGNLNGAGTDPTEHELGNLNGAGAQELEWRKS